MYEQKNLFNRRKFLQNSMPAVAALLMPGFIKNNIVFASSSSSLKTRGVVVSVDDLQTLNWPLLAHEANLTTIGTHVTPSQVSKFIQSDKGQQFLEACHKYNLQVEHELHAMHDLLPRELFVKDPSMFRMDKEGKRVADFNCCVHSKDALTVIAENAVKYAAILPSTTGRYFYWIDDGAPMCACNQCSQLSDSEQALVIENAIIKALRNKNPNAALAHLAYINTMAPPKNVLPEEGIFLEFAPIQRSWNQPLSNKSSGVTGKINGEEKFISHGDTVAFLEANLKVFPKKSAQVLEYWLDASLFSKWKKPAVKLPWHPEICQMDVDTYTQAGISHVTTFAVYIDDSYKRMYGDLNFIKEYGSILKRYA